MTTIPFDTLKMMERLEDAGFTNAQAKVQIEVLVEVISKENASMSELYLSKQDFAPELSAIRTSLGTLDAKIDRVAAEVKSELIRWVVSVGVLQTALIAGLLLKLTH
jgi:hypothetical protein